METDLSHLLSASNRRNLENARNNVPGAPTMHTARYLDIVGKILVEDKERTEWRREIEWLEERGVAKALGLQEGWALGKVSGIVRAFVGERVAEGTSGRG